MQISRGVIQGAQKVVVYGPEGIGKSYFASRFPSPLFIDTEGSTKHMDVARLPNPSSWTMLLEEVKYVKANPSVCDTLVIDTADWAERLCIDYICATKLPPKGKETINGIEDFGYGKGYTYLEEEFGRLLNLLEDIIAIDINVVFTAHSQMRKFEQPNEMGAYDRWELKLEKKTAPLLKEWADMVLFANYQTLVVNVDNQGALKGKNKAQGGKRVMYTTHHPCWDAKNRHDLLEVLDFNYDEIKHCIPARGASAPPVQTTTPPPVTPPPIEQKKEDSAPTWDELGTTYKNEQEMDAAWDRAESELNGLPKALTDLMKENKVTVKEIQQAVASKGYYPQDTPISNYDPGFINGVLVGAWAQVFKMIEAARDDIPF